MKQIYKILIVAILSLFISSAFAQTFKVIVNSANDQTSISKKDLEKYFLLKTNKWPNGSKVVPVDLKTAVTRKTFTTEVLGKSVESVKSYWQIEMFAGRAVPPAEKSSDDEVVEYVKNNSGAIGYVSSSANVSGVKAITITD